MTIRRRLTHLGSNEYAPPEFVAIEKVANPSVNERLREHAKLAKKFGEEHNLPDYINRKVKCSEDDAWKFTAVAARLGKANGAYRGPSGSAIVYMTFGQIKLKKP
jgi:hypothetical protein